VHPPSAGDAVEEDHHFLSLAEILEAAAIKRILQAPTTKQMRLISKCDCSITANDSA